MLRLFLALTLLIAERLAVHLTNWSLWQWIAAQTMIFSLAPLALLSVKRINSRDFGLAKGDLKKGLIIAGLMLIIASPFMIYGAMLPEFKAYYPLWPPARYNATSFILFETAVLLMMFNTEFYFRGLLLFSLESEFNKRGWGMGPAVLVQAFIYAGVHIGKPGLEVPYSFFVGLAFGWLALKTRSIIPSLAAHWTSSVLFDILVMIL